MHSAAEIEQLVASIAALKREELIDRLLHFRADFPLDFTPEYLAPLPLDRLQHLLLAAHMYQARKQDREREEVPAE